MGSCLPLGASGSIASSLVARIRGTVARSRAARCLGGPRAEEGGLGADAALSVIPPLPSPRAVYLWRHRGVGVASGKAEAKATHGLQGMARTSVRKGTVLYGGLGLVGEACGGQTPVGWDLVAIFQALALVSSAIEALAPSAVLASFRCWRSPAKFYSFLLLYFSVSLYISLSLSLAGSFTPVSFGWGVCSTVQYCRSKRFTTGATGQNGIAQYCALRHLKRRVSRKGRRALGKSQPSIVQYCI